MKFWEEQEHDAQQKEAEIEAIIKQMTSKKLIINKTESMDQKDLKEKEEKIISMHIPHLPSATSSPKKSSQAKNYRLTRLHINHREEREDELLLLKQSKKKENNKLSEKKKSAFEKKIVSKKKGVTKTEEKAEVKKTSSLVTKTRGFFAQEKAKVAKEKKQEKEIEAIMAKEELAEEYSEIAVGRFSSVFELLRFGGLVAAIFLILFTTTNAPAISKIVMAKINVEEETKKEIALQQMAAEKIKAPTLPTAGLKREKQDKIAPLNISIAPLEKRIVIPAIGKNIPIVDIKTDSLENEDWATLEKDIQDGLQDGVVHYPGTSEPFKMGNVFITGHSSYYFWDPGQYKDVFARLHDVELGDEFIIFWKQDKYRYIVKEIKVVSPKDTSVLDQPSDRQIVTLMTCTPIGTAINRLIIVGELVK